MELSAIEPGHYRRRVNQISLGFVAALALLSVAFGSLLIALFGQGPVASGESTGHFHLNLMGVVLALALCSAVLAGLKDKPFMAEVMLVWQTKQRHNRIFRKLAAIQAAAERKEPEALSILSYYHDSRIQVYRLDNNTLTLSEVVREQQALAERLAQWQISPPPFKTAMLDRY
ncbi:DUF3087 domain-containing protein [Ferrimonas balearica]|uniref:DUF3087 family protein n=1 Tax=Ferrimonas balearica TaxID=44012 RepID=UPI001C93FFBB|nr:DUF3087 family protein [Ferrimonas balearica]MBY6106809.1 DUF3087 domain-containing protein [Ferrimonas balearica]